MSLASPLKFFVAPSKSSPRRAMKTVGSYVGVSKSTEVLCMIVAGIVLTAFDASLFKLNFNLRQIWESYLDSSIFGDAAELYVKYIVSAVVLIRTLTVHVYLAFYVVMLWPAIFVSTQDFWKWNVEQWRDDRAVFCCRRNAQVCWYLGWWWAS